IGAGGMGEVWRATDTRLDRSVAIKILPTEFAANAQLRVRFEREAKTISQLNHPHICTLHDVGVDNGVHFLVMELLDGETLADRFQRPAAARSGASEGMDPAHQRRHELASDGEEVKPVYDRVILSRADGEGSPSHVR